MTENEVVLNKVRSLCSGALTQIQERITLYHIEKRNLIGVARPLGRGVYWPLISVNGKTCDVIDTSGYRQQASYDRTEIEY